jgi:tripeptide aminopeptidase
MDTVEKSSNVRPKIVEDNGIIRTDGETILGGDDKLGVAIIIETLHSLVADYYNGRVTGVRPIEVIFTIAEEQGAQGTRLFDTAKVRAKYGFVLDGETEVGTIIRQAPGKLKYELKAFGKKSHAALAPEEGVNAVCALCDCVRVLPTGRLDEISTANVGVIQGGEAINIVPEKASVFGEVRSVDPASLEEYKKYIESVVVDMNRKKTTVFSLKWEQAYKGYYVEEHEYCIEIFRKACQEQGLEPRLLTSLGGGDTNIFNNKGKRAVVFGVSMHNIHSNEEYVVLDELYAAAKLLYSGLKLG